MKSTRFSPIALALFFVSSLCGGLLAPIPLQAADLEAGPAWIFFSDKSIGSEVEFEAAIADLAGQYSPAAIKRRRHRTLRDEIFTYDDLPVASDYLDSILAIGGELRHTSRWLNAVSIDASAEQLSAIAALPFVNQLRPIRSVASPQRIVGDVEVTDTSTESETSGSFGFYGSAEGQLDQINITDVHNMGFTGTGVTIGVLDTGFKRTHEAFNEPGHTINVIAERDFVAEPNDNDTSDTNNNQHVHGTYILGVMGGYKPNTYVGGAYDASFLLAKTEDTSQEVQAEEDDWVAGLEWLEMNGADVVTSSLGYIDWYTAADLDGDTAVTTIAADMAAANGLPIINAAGNAGHPGNTLIAPADGDLVITVGAVDSSGTIAGFSSSGPTADGRIKPEVLAQGVSTSTVNPNNDLGYANVNGTSLSTPLVASAVALMLDANPYLSVPDIRQMLFSTADRALNPDTTNYIYGYGIIDAHGAVIEALAACMLADADCDGDVDIAGDIVPAFSNFTGPGSFGKIRTHGDVESHPYGDGDVDVSDLLLMFGAFTGPLDAGDNDGGGLGAPAAAADPNIPDLIYNAATGEVILDVDGSGIIGYVLKNGSNSFVFGNHTQILAGVKTSVSGELSEAAFATSVGANSIGDVFPTGMDLAALTAYLTVNDVSRSLGAPVVPFDLVVLGASVPEPSTYAMAAIGLLGLGLVSRQRRGGWRRNRA